VEGNIRFRIRVTNSLTRQALVRKIELFVNKHYETLTTKCNHIPIDNSKVRNIRQVYLHNSLIEHLHKIT